ncbi:MAG: hypothetical protein ACODAE_02775 [Gemmatimonadota bacterium]
MDRSGATAPIEERRWLPARDSRSDRRRTEAEAKAQAKAEAMAALKIHLTASEPPRVDFEGVVARIDLGASMVAFDNGTVVPVVHVSAIEPGASGILTLERAKRALDDGATLRARGRGRLDYDDPHVLVAETIEFTGRSP